MNVEAKHTPGPWRVADKTTKTKGFVILDGYNREVANVYQRPDYMPKEREADAANARLIAAAPEMLHALYAAEMGIAELCHGQHPDNECWNTLRDIRAAIAKAEGR